jgi:hypothetical protein
MESTILPAQMDLHFQWLDSAGQAMGRYAHACQTFFLQAVDLLNQGSHLRSFDQSRLPIPSSLELGELSCEGREAGFMVLTVEPCSVPSPERIF